MKTGLVLQKIDKHSILIAISIFALLAGYISDGIYKYITAYDISNFRISVITRGISFGMFTAYIIFFYNKSRIEIYFIILFLISFLLIGHYTFYENVKYEYNYIETINLFFKYIFVFIIFYCLIDISEKHLKILLKVYEFILYINILCVIIGIVFNVEFLKSYVWQNFRFGYNGLIYAQNESTQFYLIALIYTAHQSFVRKEKHLLFYLVLFTSLLAGTKAVIIIDLFLIVFLTLTYAKATQKIILLITLIFLICSIVLIIYTDSFRNYTDIFIRIYNESGLLTMLLSHRDELFIERFPQVINNWTTLNYLFGGHDILVYLIEMDYIDLFLYFGILGSVLFIWVQSFTIFSGFKLSNFHKFFILLYIFISFLAGHFLASAINSMYLVLLVFYLNQYYEKRIV